MASESLVAVEAEADAAASQVPAMDATKDDAVPSADVTLTSGNNPHAAAREDLKESEAPLKRVDRADSTQRIVPDSVVSNSEPTDGQHDSIASFSTEGVNADSMAASPSEDVAADSSATGEGIHKPSTASVTSNLPSTEAVAIDSSMTERATADSGAVATETYRETGITDSAIPITTSSIEVDITASITETIDLNPHASITTPSIEAAITVNTALNPAESSATVNTRIEPPLEELNRATDKREKELPADKVTGKWEEELPAEIDSIEVPAHWHSKPCVHVSSIGGRLIEEELIPLFNKYGPIASVSFENEKHDAVLLRYELHLENGEELLAQVRQATNNTKLGDKTLIVEPFRPDSLLFVGNLTPDIDDTSLKTMFEPHGRVERAFVLRNAQGQSKCYGFVEYSLKSQAVAAKIAMGNINMEGRVLRVEWSDCKKVEDMLSTVLFIDKLPREGPHIEGALNELFGKFGRIRDCHLVVGNGNQMRGFAFIDFYYSSSADKAHQALDGHFFEGSSIRVSFANPSKSAHSYKARYGAQAGPTSVGRGGPPGGGMMMSATSRGPPFRGPSPRGSAPMPLLPTRFMGPIRPGMVGLGIGMQFGRGTFDRSPFYGGARGMVGPSRPSVFMGGMGPRPGTAVIETNRAKLPFAPAPMSITPNAIVQVATAQARAREEEAKARAEAARQGVSRPGSAAEHSPSVNYQKFQQMHQQNYLQQQQYDQHYKQGDPYTNQQAQQGPPQSHPNTWNQQHYQHGYQISSTQRMPHHTYPSQNYAYPSQNYLHPQQPQMDQSAQQHGHTSQYGQQQGYQYGQQVAQPYGQVPQQQTTDQYQQPMQQPQAAYAQQGEHYGAQQHAYQQSYSGSAAQDAAQQAAYAAYYQQQQAQAQAHAQMPVQAQAGTNAEAGSVGTSTSSTPATTQQSYEAQWAAYYASQAAYQQQQAPSTDVGQKRSADQVDSSQAAYNYASYPQQQVASQQQQQQVSNETATAYQQQAAYQQQQQQAAYYQQPGYQQAGVGYEQPSSAAASGGDGAYQQPTAYQVPAQGQTGVYDYSKRPRF